MNEIEDTLEMNEIEDTLEKVEKENLRKFENICFNNLVKEIQKILKQDKITNAFNTIKQAMIDDEPEKLGSYAHAWHCIIAMSVYDEIKSNNIDIDNNLLHKICNNAASRFMNLCFGVNTNNGEI